jgi:restriction system protein
MFEVKAKCSQVTTYYTKSGLPRYYVDVEHAGLNKYRRIKGDALDVVIQKASAQGAQWDEQWSKKQAAEEKRARAEQRRKLAEERTQDAQELIARIEGLLAQALEGDPVVDWDSLRRHSEFRGPRKFREPEPTPPKLQEPPPQPMAWKPRLGLLDHLIPSRAERKYQKTEEAYARLIAEWEKERQLVDRQNAERLRQHKKAMRAWREKREAFLQQREVEKQAFLERRRKHNEAVDKRMAAYAAAEPKAIADYCDLVLSQSEYPDFFPQDYDLDYNPETRTLIVDYQLPPPDKMPTVKEVKYIKTRDELKEVPLSERDKKRLYDAAIYQIALRSLHELFNADSVKGLDAVAFNGLVTSVDQSTGHEVTACIISLHVSREEFVEIDLSRVDAKACFKALKGVGSSKLHSLAPVKPIIEMEREDKRFVSSREVADGLDEADNIAAMDWEEFEHLVRELFEREFAQGGGEVKVTQASRDGGVDAIAFDPDPIRGGKIVIQAKRYVNTVGVAAVRDLYGTVVNEGAIKGILVTTAEYGPDAYRFAKDKPLTLLNGANLLHLLQKHGHKAKIDLPEARRVLSEREKQR